MKFILWNDPLGKKECPYAYRWVFNFGLFSIRIHKWIRSDDKRYFHDHPWSFITFVLKGSYTDVSPNKKDDLNRWSIRYRKSTHKHYVKVKKGGALTLLVTGPQTKNWGFWIKKKLLYPSQYFKQYGHPPCSEL